MSSFQPWLWCLFLTIAGAAAAQNSKSDTIRYSLESSGVFKTVDSIFARHAREKRLPSVAWGVVAGGKLVHAGFLGVANREKGIPASALSAYHIASMTKSITALAIVKLRDEGKLRLDDPVQKFIPAFSMQEGVFADAPAVTVRDLLIHAAGFPEDNPWGDRQLGQSREWLQRLVDNGISFSSAPGTAYEYSNLGYALLGLIIEQVVQKPYQEYITHAILKPLSMLNTRWDYAHVPANRLVIGYRLENGNYVPQPMLHSGSFGAMGGLITTVEDFARYMAFHLQAWPSGSAPETGPVKRSSLREMHHGWNFVKLWVDEKDENGDFCPIVDFYGYGLHLYENCRGRKTITHSGGLPGFGSQWRALPQYGIGVVAFANLTYAPMGAPVNEALDSLLVAGTLKPYVVAGSPVLEQHRDRLLKLFSNDWQGAEASGIFADNFFKDHSVHEFRAKTRQAYAAAGAIQSVTAVEPVNRLRGSFLFRGDKASIRVFFTLTPQTQPKIQALRITVEP